MSYQTPIERAQAFLFDLLQEGPLPAEAVVEAAREHRISRRLLEVARQALRVREQHGRWSLP